MDPERRAKALAIVGVVAGAFIMAIAMGLDIRPLGGLWPSARDERAVPDLSAFANDLSSPAVRADDVAPAPTTPEGALLSGARTGAPATLPDEPDPIVAQPPHEPVAAPDGAAQRLMRVVSVVLDDVVVDELVAPTVDLLGLGQLLDVVGVDLAQVRLLTPTV